MANLGVDSFVGRTVASGLGLASDGINTWAQVVGTSGANVTSGEGQITGTATGVNQWQCGTATSGDFDIRMRMEVDATGQTPCGVFARASSGGTTHYRVNLRTASLEIRKSLAGTATTLVSAACTALSPGPFTYSALTFYWIRFQLSGTTLSAKAWPDSQPEPANFQISVADSSITGVGTYGIFTSLLYTTNYSKFDTFSATDNASATNYTTSITEALATAYAEVSLSGNGSAAIAEYISTAYAEASLQGSGSQAITEQIASAYAEATSNASAPQVAITEQLSSAYAESSMQGAGTVSILEQIGTATAESSSLGSATTSITEQLATAYAEAALLVSSVISITEQISTAYAEATSTASTPPPVLPGITVTINGTAVMIREGSFSLDDSVNAISTCIFTVRDDTGTQHFTRGMPVSVTDSVRGLVFSGFVNRSQEDNKRPNTLIFSTVDCVDNHYLVEKRTFAGPEYTNQYAGAIVADMAASVLSQEGITAEVASRRETTGTQLSTGTLTNVAAGTGVSGGDLELSPAGTLFTKTEQNSTDWLATGSTLVGTYYGGPLTLFPNNALKLQGYSSQGGTNNFTYIKIWAGNQIISSGDHLNYFVWIASTSPASIAGVDLVCTDGTTMRDNTGIVDQNGLRAHPNADLSGFANDQRYSRSIDLSLLAGKTVSYVTVVLEGDPTGMYTAYFDSIVMVNSANTVLQNFYTNTLQTSAQLNNVGYSQISLTQTTTYTNPGYRTSPAFSLAAAGIASTSKIDWVESLLTTPTATPLQGGAVGAGKVPYVLIETSIDGGTTWQTCTNHGAIPNLVAGMNLTGQMLQFRQTLNVAGPDPTVTPALSSITATVQPSYTATKSDVLTSYGVNGTSFTAGTLSNLLVGTSSDLVLNGQFRAWNDGNVGSQMTWGQGSIVTAGIIAGQYAITNLPAGSNVDVRSEFQFAGTWSDFTMEVDVYINSFGDYGMLYRASSWSNTNNATNGYNVMINLTTIYLGYNSAGIFTQLTTVGGLGLQAGVWHRLKVVCSGSSHKIYLDDILYINLTDTHYSSGEFGCRFYNTSNAQHSGFFDNFGVVVAQSGTWTSPSISLNSVGTVGNATSMWNMATPQPTNTTVLIEARIGTGSYQACTNNGQIPQLPPGTSVSGKTLQLRVTLSGVNANMTPDLLGLSVLVTGSYTASGTRISPTLSLANITRLGNSLVAWNANLPSGTTLGVDTRLDAGAWVVATSGGTVAGLNTQPASTDDTYSVNTSANYTSTFKTGGAVATWAGDYANSRILATGGTNALYVNTLVSAVDHTGFLDLDQSDTGGMIFRYVDQNNFYEAVIQDASSTGGTPNSIALFTVAANVRTQRASASIAFTRGTYHRFQWSMIGGAMTISMDGLQTLTYTDGAPLGAGKCGLRNSGGSARFYQLSIQPLGDVATSHTFQLQLRLGSTNPRATPQVLNTTLQGYGNSINPGILIPQTKYAYKYVSQCYDDLAKQSDYWWYTDKNRKVSFLPTAGVPAPWIASDNPGDFLNAGITLTNQSDLYRNRSIVYNVLQTTPINESRMGDGVTQTWTFSYQWYSAPTITINGVAATVGIKGVDTGKQFYWLQGDPNIYADTHITIFDQTQTLNFLGTGHYLTFAQADNTSQQTTLAAIENARGGSSSGIVEVAEDGKGIPYSAGLALAQARNAQYSVLGIELNATTRRYGLAPGQLLAVFLPEFNLYDTVLLVEQVKTKLTTEYGGQQGWYTIKASNGALLGDWTNLYKRS